MAKSWVISIPKQGYLAGYGLTPKPTKAKPHKREISIHLTQTLHPPYDKQHGFPPIFFRERKMAEHVCAVIAYLFNGQATVTEVQSEETD